MSGRALVWFRDDLRLSDNPALTAAARDGRPIAALYVLDEATPGLRAIGGAAKWWLHRSLEALSRDLAARGVELIIRIGRSTDVVPAVAKALDVTAVHWNRRVGTTEIKIDTELKALFKARGLEVASHQANLLFEPWTIANKTGGFFKVYTPFARALRALETPRTPLPAPAFTGFETSAAGSVGLSSLGLLPTKPDWSAGIAAAWTVGEAAARMRLERFLDTAIAGYADGRNRPDQVSTSRLSPHLKFGETSPFQVWHAAELRGATGRAPKGDVDKFLAEVLWREFAYHLLHHHPDLATRNFQPRFDEFPWRTDPAELTAWQKGQTGYPIVDAGMRELWTTGWMHNRVRMIVGSFLVKHLLLDWRHGEAWFWDTLVDADPANNTASWQWVAGTGADAAPYFRVFNPILQGEKFDPKGAYVKQWCPELAQLPTTAVHKPWTLAPHEASRFGVRLGVTYPKPIIDHEAGRRRALEAFETLKDGRTAAE
jgi:deoxyribodipyrimidine photo-lyase